MDKKQLVTIAITAVVSVIFKEVLTWLISRAKIMSVSDTAKQRAKKIFSKNNLAIVWHLSCLSSQYSS